MRPEGNAGYYIYPFQRGAKQPVAVCLAPTGAKRRPGVDSSKIIFVSPATPQCYVVRMQSLGCCFPGRGLDMTAGRDDQLSGDGTRGYG